MLAEQQSTTAGRPGSQTPSKAKAEPLPPEGRWIGQSFYVDASRSDWQATEAPGFWTKPLYDNAERGEHTSLMRVDAGAYFPPHAHHGEWEQIFVLEGSFYDDDRLLRAGDFACRRPGALHAAGSEDGAVVLLLYTRNDD